MDFSTQSGSASLNEGDNNALLFPCKKNDKKKKAQYENKKQKKLKVFANVEDSKSKKLSKSQKRKLKKLAEEKENEKLLSQSLEFFEKSKISDEASSFLVPSKKIGQAVTRKERRQREMQFAKAGLGSLYSDPPTKRMKCSDAKSDVDNSYPDESMHHVIVESGCPLSPEILTEGTYTTISEGFCTLNADLVTKEASDGVLGKKMQVDSISHSPNSCFRSDQISTATVMPSPVKNGVDDRAEQTVSQVMDHREGLKQGVRAPPIVVQIRRPEKVEKSRKDLPIIMMEQEIMEAIKENITVIICGETGCGKTTQLPQFLYEAGFGSNISKMHSGIIGITQPRRVAVRATAARVAYELGLKEGEEVGCQVRYDKRVGKNCSIKFMTDGILLREVQSDFLLKHYSVIILDEAHERSVNTDILIGMLSRVIKQRQALYEEQEQKMLSGEVIKPDNLIFPLKLILMSATLRIEDFTSGTRIFHQPPPLIEVPARQFPVTTYFSKRTHENYMGLAYKKVLDIHKKLPPGGILVFVTGKREVLDLCSKLWNASKELVQRYNQCNIGNEDVLETCDMIDEDLEVESSQQPFERFSLDECDGDSDVEGSVCSETSENESELEFNEDDADILDPKASDSERKLADVLGGNGNYDVLKAGFEALARGDAGCDRNKISPMTDPSMEKKREEQVRDVGPMCVLPLYAKLGTSAQDRVLTGTKGAERLVVVATNVAETSLTIPGIKYVVDTGKVKVRNYDTPTGMESYEVQWISKASADQRAGRAGRTGPGHCYRLYSAAAFSNEFRDFSCAEISKISVDGVVLVMKSMGISKVVNFPFPTPPEANAVIEAERCLKALEALDGDGRLTSLGKLMAQYPLNPQHSRMLLTAVDIMRKEGSTVRPYLVIGYAVAAAAALSLSNPFDNMDHDEKSGPSDGIKVLDKEERHKRKKLREAMKLSRAKFSNPRSDALTAAYTLQCYELSSDQSGFCKENFLVARTMLEMSKLKEQLLKLLFRNSFCCLNQEFSCTEEDVERAWKVPSEKCPLSRAEEDLLCRAICAGWADRIAKCIRSSNRSFEGDVKVHAARYQACSIKETIYLHRWSSASRSDPEYLVYSELVETKRPYIFGATGVESSWLVHYAKALCTFSAPLVDPKPCYDHTGDQVLCSVVPYFGPHSWELPLHKIPIKDALERVTVFAYALLDGQVLPCLKSARNFMAAQPTTVLKPEAAGQKRVGNLVGKLRTRSRTTDSCEKLREAWEENPMHLYSEIKDWFRSEYRSQYDKLWETMLKEALLSPEERFPSRGKKNKLQMRKSSR